MKPVLCQKQPIAWLRAGSYAGSEALSLPFPGAAWPEHGPCGGTVRARDPQGQTNQLIAPGAHSGQIEPFDDPHPRTEKNAMHLGSVAREAADRKIIHADGPHAVLDQELGRRSSDVNIVLDERVGLPAPLRIQGILPLRFPLRLYESSPHQ